MKDGMHQPKHFLIVFSRRIVHDDFVWLPTRGSWIIQNAMFNALLWGHWIVAWGTVERGSGASGEWFGK